MAPTPPKKERTVQQAINEVSAQRVAGGYPAVPGATNTGGGSSGGGGGGGGALPSAAEIQNAINEVSAQRVAGGYPAITTTAEQAISSYRAGYSEPQETISVQTTAQQQLTSQTGQVNANQQSTKQNNFFGQIYQNIRHGGRRDEPAIGGKNPTLAEIRARNQGLSFSERFTNYKSEAGKEFGYFSEDFKNFFGKSVKPKQEKEVNKEFFVGMPTGPINREQEKTTEFTYFGIGKPGFGATGQAVKNVFDFGTIGEKGFGDYYSNIFSPYSQAGRFSEGEVKPTAEFLPFISGSGTKISQGYIPFGDITTTKGLSTAEIGLLERKKTGEFGPELTITTKALMSAESEKITKRSGLKAQEEFNIGAGQLAETYQGKINTGELSYEQAVSDYGRTTGILGEGISAKYSGLSQKEFESSMGAITQRRGISGAGEKYSTGLFDISKPIEFGVTTGALIAASSTPTGMALVSAGFLGKGTADITGGILQKDISLGAVGVAEAGFGIFGARAVAGPQRELIKFGGGEVSVPANMIERQWRKELFQDLKMEKTFLKSKGPPEMFEDYTQIKLTGGRGGPKFGIKENININLKAFQVGENEVTVAGTGLRKVSYKTLFGETIKLPTEKFGVGTIHPAITREAPATFLAGKGGVTIEEGFGGATGKAYVKQFGGDMFTSRRFVSISQETPEGFKIIGGRRTIGKYGRDVKMDFNIQQPDFVKLYHGTTRESAEMALKFGLKPAKELGISRGLPTQLKEVYATPDIARARGWAGRAFIGKGIPSGTGTEILEINLPRAKFDKLFIRRGFEKGGGEEVALKRVPSKYISLAGEGKTPYSLTFDFNFPRTLKMARGNIESRVFIEKPVSADASRMFRQVIQRGKRGGLSTDVFSRMDTSVMASEAQRLLQVSPPIQKSAGGIISASYGAGQTGVSMLKPVSLPVTTALGFPTASAYAGTGLYEREGYMGGILAPPGPKEGLKINYGYKRTFTDFGGTKFDISGREKFGPKFTGSTATIFKDVSGLRSGQVQIQPSASGLKMEQGLKLKPVQFVPELPGFEFSFEPITSKPKIPFGFFMPGGNIFEGYVSRRAGKRKYKRQPSLVSAEFNIRSLKPSRGEFTGLVSRPII